MELVPLDTQEPMEDNSYLSDRAIFSRNHAIERRLRNKGKRETLSEQLDACSELIGGVPRMAIWADENPTEFYALRARMSIAQQTKKIDHTIKVIEPAIPRSVLDGPPPIDAEFTEGNDAAVSPQKD